MATTTFDPTDEGPNPEIAAAEARALEQGEKIIQAQEEDRQAVLDRIDTDQEDVALIGGKFKSQDDLLKAYEELQKKMGNSEPEEGEELSEEQPEATEEVPDEEVSTEVTETVTYMNELGRQFEEKGELSSEDVEKLGSMDPKQLVQAYLAYNTQAKSASLQQSQVDSIMEIAGGAEQYADMVAWAGQNLPDEDVADFNAVTATNNPAAIKFAVQSLASRYRGDIGYEAPLVSGKAPGTAAKGFRSHAELSRAIADPRYQSDAAYRSDVEDRLARSTDLL
jgi:hypothetical protein